MLTFLSSQCWHLFIVAFYLRSSRLFRWQVVFNWKQSFSYYVLRLLILFKPLVLVGFPRHLSWRRRDATHYCLEVDVQVPIQPPLTPKKGCPHSCCTGVGVQAPLMIIDTVEGKKRQAHYWPGGMKVLASCLASPPHHLSGDVEAAHYRPVRVEVQVLHSTFVGAAGSWVTIFFWCLVGEERLSSKYFLSC